MRREDGCRCRHDALRASRAVPTARAPCLWSSTATRILLRCLLHAGKLVNRNPDRLRESTALTTLREVGSAMAVVLTVGYGLLVWQFYLHVPVQLRRLCGRDRAALASKLAPETMPDVYHIILDAFGRPDTLRAQYGLDLSDFVRGLKGRGFQVRRRGGKLSADLPVDRVDVECHLSGPSCRGESASDVEMPVYEMIQQSPVLELFKRSGYRFVFVGSIYSATQSHRLADECVCDTPIIGEFGSIVGMTPFAISVSEASTIALIETRSCAPLEALESLPPSSGPGSSWRTFWLRIHPCFRQAGRPSTPGEHFRTRRGYVSGSRTGYQKATGPSPVFGEPTYGPARSPRSRLPSKRTGGVHRDSW